MRFFFRRKVIPVALEDLERLNILSQGLLSRREGQIEVIEMLDLGDGGVRVAGEGWGLRFAPAPALAWIGKRCPCGILRG